MKNCTALICLVVILLSFTSCTGETVSINVGGAADTLLATLEFDDQMAPLEREIIERLYDIDMSKVKDVKVYSGTGATPEEIAVFEAVDAASVQDVKTAVQARVETRKEDFQDYIPEEMPKLENAQIVTKGNYVILVINKDGAKAKEEIEKLF